MDLKYFTLEKWEINFLNILFFILKFVKIKKNKNKKH